MYGGVLLRAYTALAKDSSLVPSIHVRQLITSYNSRYREMQCFRPPQELALMHTYPREQIRLHGYVIDLECSSVVAGGCLAHMRLWGSSLAQGGEGNPTYVSVGIRGAYAV